MSNDQFDKLTRQLNERFDDIGKRFAEQDTKLERRLAEQDAAFKEQLDNLALKLYAHTERRFGELDAKIDSTRHELNDRLDQVISTLDKVLKNQETDEQERLAIIRQVDQHEDWIGRASAELKIKYDRAG